MVDLQTVCCMCGDIGFPDKLFRCNNCRNRFQHSNYYSESAEAVKVCDWCQCEGKITSSKHRMTSSSSSKKSTPAGSDVRGSMNRSEYSGDKIKHIDREENSPADKAKNSPSPRPTTRRYKLLKDVMC